MSNHENLSSLLIAKYFARTITPQEMDLLEERIREDSETGDMFYRNFLCDYLLQEKFAAYSGETLFNITQTELDWDALCAMQNAEKPIQKNSDSRPKQRFFLLQAYEDVVQSMRSVWDNWNQSLVPGISLVCLLFFTMMFFMFLYERNVTVKGEHEEITTVARINEVIDTVWTPDTPVYKAGQLVDECRLSLLTGLVQIEMNNGTKLILEGPGELVINGPMTSFCNRGKLSVVVSREAVGYKVATPFGTVTDRGTEFFLNVSDQGSQVEVIKGMVDFLSLTEESCFMTTGNAIDIKLAKKIERLKVPAISSFISLPEFQLKVRNQEERTLQKKEERNKLVDHDSSLLARFDFSVSNETIQNKSIAGEYRIPHLNIQGCRWTRYESSQSQVLRIDQKGDAPSFEYPDYLNDMTVIAKTRLDKFGSTGNVLIASDDFPNTPGAFLWQISPEGHMQFHVKDTHGMIQCETISGIVPSRILKTWTTFAITVRAKSQEIAFYMDGECVSVLPWKYSGNLMLGKCQIGNLSNRDLYYKERFLNGAIKDFYIFKRALSKKEIKYLNVD